MKTGQDYLMMINDELYLFTNNYQKDISSCDICSLGPKRCSSIYHPSMCNYMRSNYRLSVWNRIFMNIRSLYQVIRLRNNGNIRH